MPMNHTSLFASAALLLLAGLIVFADRAEADAAEGRWTNSLKPAGRPGPELHLAAGGKALYRIVMPAGAAGKEKLAAEKLGHYLGQMTGAEFALVEEGPDFQPTGREISIGRTRLLAEADPPQLQKDLGADGYAVAVKDRQLLIFGRTPAGTL